MTWTIPSSVVTGTVVSIRLAIARTDELRGVSMDPPATPIFGRLALSPGHVPMKLAGLSLAAIDPTIDVPVEEDQDEVAAAEAAPTPVPSKSQPGRFVGKRPASRSALVPTPGRHAGSSGGPVPALGPRTYRARSRRVRHVEAESSPLGEEGTWIQSDDEGRYYPPADPATRPSAQQLEEIRVRAAAI